jgi:hypothetical protein
MLTEIRMKQYPDGRVECLKCHYKWRMFKAPKDRRCKNCRCPMYPRPFDPASHCHESCTRGLCSYMALDFMVSRQKWRALPGRKGIVWRVEEARPLTLHDLMIEFGKNKDIIYQFLDKTILNGWTTRERKITQAPIEVNRVKQKTYRYPDGHRAPKNGRSRRPTFYRYTPTHWAMGVFLRRHADNVTLDRLGENLIWTPVRPQKKELGNYVPICKPRTKEERDKLRDRLMNLRTNNVIGWAPNRL